MDYAPSLETILLQDKASCKRCDETNSKLIYPTSSMFPKSKDEKDMILNQLRIGISHSVQILFM